MHIYNQDISLIRIWS